VVAASVVTQETPIPILYCTEYVDGVEAGQGRGRRDPLSRERTAEKTFATKTGQGKKAFNFNIYLTDLGQFHTCNLSCLVFQGLL